MEKLIKQLVQEKKEGVWWDFKLKHHDNLATLLHDVLCLANTLYDGDRYIIFGVSDSFEIIGIQENDRRNTQADIIDFFRKNSFAYHNIPNITLNTCSFGSMEIDVLVIKNSKNKPYFLTQDIIKNSKTIVRAGVIYSRSEDANTPKNSCANPYEIEAMWRDRFGLNDTPSERFYKILLDYNNWKYDGYSFAFYDIDPDFTIEIGESEEEVDKTRWWGTIDAEKVTKNNYNLKYKNVTLQPIQVIRFCNENLCIPYPQIEYIMHKDNCDKYNIDIDFYCDLFFFRKDTIQYSFLKHIRGTEVTPTETPDFSTPLKTQRKPPIIELPFLFIEDEMQLDNIRDYLISNFDDFLDTLNCSSSISNIEDDTEKKRASEKLFSEWSFNFVRDNYF